jgi:hypothetical protein
MSAQRGDDDGVLLLYCEGASVHIEPISAAIDLTPAARIVPLRRRPGCALLARDGVTLNGRPALPIQVLRDRDEIRAAGRAIYFTTDAIPEESTLQSATPLRCARCLGGVAAGDRVIRCPGCRAHHHSRCWNEGGRCHKCHHPAASLSWTPEAL